MDPLIECASETRQNLHSPARSAVVQRARRTESPKRFAKPLRKPQSELASKAAAVRLPTRRLWREWEAHDRRSTLPPHGLRSGSIDRTAALELPTLPEEHRHQHAVCGIRQNELGYQVSLRRINASAAIPKPTIPKTPGSGTAPTPTASTETLSRAGPQPLTAAPSAV